MIYQERFYRKKLLNNKLRSYQITVRETDLFISSDIELKELALTSILKYRSYIESYARNHPDFLTSLVPMAGNALAPDIVRDMLAVSRQAGVGPMAAVAGAIAQNVAVDLLSESDNVIVENGGDIFMKVNMNIEVGIFAGASPLSEKMALRIRPEQTPVGICTSSATVGPSLNFGKADAVCVKASSASLADAVATAVGNRITSGRDIIRALDFGSQINGVLGILIILDEHLGIRGDMELLSTG
jgi:uncharacterized protein